MVSIVSHGAAFIAFGGFAIVLLLGGNRQGTALHLVGASAGTAAWGAAVAIAAAVGQVRSPPELIAEILRSIVWILFLYRLLAENATRHGTRIPRTAIIAVAALFAS